MDSLNRMALELTDEALEFAEELRVGAVELDSGATVLDFGVDHVGGVEAGLLLAELQTAGLATVQTRVEDVAGDTLPHVEVSTDHPALALLCSQKAGWELAVDGFEGLGSGPARALVADEREFRQVGYTDAFEFAVLAVESDALPTDAVARRVADRAGVDPGSVFLPTYPAASTVGSVTAAARAAELALFRLQDLDYDPTDVLTASAVAPVVPVAGTESAAVARTTDALAYGGRVHLTVDEDADVFAEVPSTAADDYGTPFADVFASHDWALHEVSDAAFAPAQVTVSVVGGRTETYGTTRPDLLAAGYASP